MDDDEVQLIKRFEQMVAGAGLDDLRSLVGRFLGTDDSDEDDRQGPELRRPPRDEAALYRVRVDLDGARPPIWRRLDLRSDVTLDVVHDVLQTAFGWWDAHLHRFALGGGVFDPDSQWFCCPFDVEEEGGLAAAAVRLDETLHDPGDVLRYVYDYGDSWHLTIRLEQVLPAQDDSPVAVAVAGRRAGPPEDCGGLRDADELAQVLADPAAFDLDLLNQQLAATAGGGFADDEAPGAGPAAAAWGDAGWGHAGSDGGGLGLPRRLEQMTVSLRGTPVGPDVSSVTLGLAFEPRRPTDDELARALHAHTWFLDWAAEGAIPLTSAGYLRPADVPAAAFVVPAMVGWIGQNNREANAVPLLAFRQSLRTLGLLRKNRERLVLTRAGTAARQDLTKLWDRLVAALVPAGEGFDTDATLLLLAYAATELGTDDPDPTDTIAKALTLLGWEHHDGSPIEPWEVTRLPAYDLLRNLSDRGGRPGWPFGPVAQLLAHTALRTAGSAEAAR